MLLQKINTSIWFSLHKEKKTKGGPIPIPVSVSILVVSAKIGIEIIKGSILMEFPIRAY